MKKLLSIVLALTMVFTLSATAFAAQPTDEQTLIEVNTDEGLIKVTGIEDAAGNISVFEYHNDELAIVTRYTPGETYYERLEVNESQLPSGATWEVVDFSDSIVETPPAITPFAQKTRQLGYMYYNNQLVGEIYAIKCHVDEWYDEGKKVEISGNLGTLADFVQFIVGALGISLGIAGKLAQKLTSAAVVAIVGGVVKTLVTTEVTANVTDQRIYGVCTSHSGKPIGDLGNASIIYVTSDNSRYANDVFYEGYTTHMWGTGELGRMMFWKVFGVEYTPTSWTGV